jgi:hypothetical protein
MSIFVGIFSRTPQYPIEDSTCESMKRVISRNPGEEVTIYRDKMIFLAKVDVGAYGKSAFYIDPSGSVSMLAGEPLLDLGDGDTLRTRREDLEMLHKAWDKGNWDVVRSAQGIFCAMHYHPVKRCLSLIADKLGFRPLYYWSGKKYVVFSTAVRILESLAEVPKTMDVRAVTEIANLGFLLSNRTPYSDILRLGAAEVLQFSENGESQLRYWHWDKIPQSSESEDELLRKVYEDFATAVINRLRNDTSTFCTLSGGLDSRCVTAILRSRNVIVHTINYARLGTQDSVLGAWFSREIGSIHEEVKRNHKPSDFETIAAWKASKQREAWQVERPSLVWTGGGGSVGLGHVYLDETIVNLMRSGKREAAVDWYLNRQHIAILRRLLNPTILDSLSGTLKLGIIERLEKIRCDDPGRDFYLFLMLDEQKFLFSNYYEDIDMHRFEFHFPFLDSNFLASVISVPIDFCLRHHFYHRLLRYFPPAVASVPWQAYPNHEPCPLPIPPGLAYQWDNTSPGPEAALRKREWLRQATELLKAKDFPYPIMNRWYLRLATWIFHTGLRDYGYVIKNAGVYNKYWVKSGGKYELPSENPISS